MSTRTRLLAPALALAVAACSTPIPVPTPTSSPAPAPAAAAPTPPEPAPTTSPTQELIDFLGARVAQAPDDAAAQRDLGLAILQRIRETADPSAYPAAESALQRARDLAPDDPLVLVGLGGLRLGQHRFDEALDVGRAALDLAPGFPSARVVVVDALIELGRYDQGFAEAQALAASAPDLASLARQSYALELQGDLPQALSIMERAAASPGLAPENSAYVTSLVGHLRLLSGDRSGAREAFEGALDLVPDHPPALAGLGRAALGAGDLAEAEARFRRATEVVPLPEYVIALAETQEAAGDVAAERTFALARAEIDLFAANGVAVELELALFEADHGDPTRALALAEAAYGAAPTIRAADAVGWALYHLGRFDEAAERSDEALRLGSVEPLLRYHAGAIAAASGRDADATTHLRIALGGDAGFSARGAADAARLLEELTG